MVEEKGGGGGEDRKRKGMGRHVMKTEAALLCIRSTFHNHTHKRKRAEKKIVASIGLMNVIVRFTCKLNSLKQNKQLCKRQNNTRALLFCKKISIIN